MDEFEDFFDDIASLKHSERQGWKDIGVTGTRDTIASHSFGAALLGWSLAEEENLNSDRVVKMLLMHDLIMSYVDDYTPEDEEFESKREKEEKMAEKLFSDIPENIRDEFRDLYREFQDEETVESELAHEADKLDTLLQALNYSEELGEDHLEEFLESYRDYFRTDTGKEIFRQLEGRDLDTS